MIKCGKKLEEALEIELQNAREQGEYHSNHEAFAIMKEEIEEADIEMERMRCAFVTTWGYVRTDEDDIAIKRGIKQVKLHAELAIAELIQVSACAEKWLEFIKREEADEGKNPEEKQAEAE